MNIIMTLYKMLFIYLDIYLIIILILLVIMIFSGFISLIERKLMATIQNRVGPALFLMGLLTPIFDGVKLILKFNVIVINIDILYLFLITFFSIIFNYIVLYILPFTNILWININFNHFIFLNLHLMLAVVNTFLVGCFILNTCFIYLATMRSILCSIIAELCMILLFIFIINIDFYSLLSFKYINEFNIILNNFYIVPFLFIIIIILVLYINSLTNLFEYAEAESELVAGTITEYSGLFFCIASLIEIFHIITSVVLFTMFLFGGFYFNFKIIIILIFLFILPKLIMVRLKLNNMFFLFYIYIFIFIFIIIVFLNLLKFIFILFW